MIVIFCTRNHWFNWYWFWHFLSFFNFFASKILDWHEHWNFLKILVFFCIWYFSIFSSYVAYRLVHSLAILSCSSRFCKYCVAMLPTRGSAGLQSVSREQILNSTFEIVNAGLQLSFKMSRHITPWELILQW